MKKSVAHLHGCASIGPMATELKSCHVVAAMWRACVTIRARATEPEGQNDRVTYLDLCDCAADFLDDPCALMAEDSRRWNTRLCTDIGVANSRRNDANKNLVVARLVEFDAF